MLGNGRVEAQCFDGEKRLAHIRGKMRKKVTLPLFLFSPRLLSLNAYRIVADDGRDCGQGRKGKERKGTQGVICSCNSNEQALTFLEASLIFLPGFFWHVPFGEAATSVRHRWVSCRPTTIRHEIHTSTHTLAGFPQLFKGYWTLKAPEEETTQTRMTGRATCNTVMITCKTIS